MSKRAGTKFLSKIAEDSTLHEQLQTALAGKEDQNAAVVEFANQHGYQFTVEEFTETMQGLHRHYEGELCDEALEQISGGLQDFYSSRGDIQDRTRTRFSALLKWKSALPKFT